MEQANLDSYYSFTPHIRVRYTFFFIISFSFFNYFFYFSFSFFMVRCERDGFCTVVIHVVNSDKIEENTHIYVV